MGAPRNVRGGGDKRSWRGVIAVLVLAALVMGQAQPALADDPLQQALKKKQDLERAVQLARQNIERYQTAANRFQIALDAANVRIGDLAAKAEAAQSEAEALGFEILIAEEQLQLVTFQLQESEALASSLRAQLAEQTRQLSRREDLYAQHLRSTYQQSRISPIEMLLSSTTLADFAGRVEALAIINRQDVRLASDIRLLRSDTITKSEDAVAAEKEMQGLLGQISVTRSRLDGQKAEYDGLVQQLQGSISEQAGLKYEAAVNRNQSAAAAGAAARETARLNKQLEEAEALYEILAAQQAAGSGLGVYSGGKLTVWPVRGPITSPFGPRWGGFHNGTDIAAPMYRPVVAAAPGKVMTVGKPYLAAGDTATVVIIAHGSNLSTLYGHLDDVTKPPPVRVGQVVNAGQIIGYVGMTGWTTGPHLHFMTISNGRAVDPAPFLP